MYGIPDYLAVGFWLAGFFWTAAALCYFFGGSTDLVISLLTIGLLGALAKWIVSQRSGR
jgi:hypothetical protein